MAFDAAVRGHVVTAYSQRCALMRSKESFAVECSASLVLWKAHLLRAREYGL